MPRKAVLLFSALILVALCSCHKKSAEEERQAKIENALKGIKDKDANVRGEAVVALGDLIAKKYVKDIAELLRDEDYDVRFEALWALQDLGAREYTNDIAGLLKDGDAMMRAEAILTLEVFGANEYADEIGKLISDSAKCRIYDAVKKDWRETTVSAEAERVLKEWKQLPADSGQKTENKK